MWNEVAALSVLALSLPQCWGVKVPPRLHHINRQRSGAVNETVVPSTSMTARASESSPPRRASNQSTPHKLLTSPNATIPHLLSVFRNQTSDVERGTANSDLLGSLANAAHPLDQNSTDQQHAPRVHRAKEHAKMAHQLTDQHQSPLAPHEAHHARASESLRTQHSIISNEMAPSNFSTRSNLLFQLTSLSMLKSEVSLSGLGVAMGNLLQKPASFLNVHANAKDSAGVAMIIMSIALALLVSVMLHAYRHSILNRARLLLNVDKFEEFKMYIFVYEAKYDNALNGVSRGATGFSKSRNDKGGMEVSVRVTVGGKVKATKPSSTGKFRKAMTFPVPQNCNSIQVELVDQTDVLALRTFDVVDDILSGTCVIDRFYKLAPKSPLISNAYVRVRLGPGCPDLDDELDLDKSWGCEVPGVEDMMQMQTENEALKHQFEYKKLELERQNLLAEAANNQANQAKAEVERLTALSRRSSTSISHGARSAPLHGAGKAINPGARSVPLPRNRRSMWAEMHPEEDEEEPDQIDDGEPETEDNLTSGPHHIKDENAQAAWDHRVSDVQGFDVDPLASGQSNFELAEELQDYEAKYAHESMEVRMSQEGEMHAQASCITLEDQAHHAEVALSEVAEMLQEESEEIHHLYRHEEEAMEEHRAVELEADEIQHLYSSELSELHSELDEEANAYKDQETFVEKIVDEQRAAQQQSMSLSQALKWKAKAAEMQRDEDINKISDELVHAKADLMSELADVKAQEAESSYSLQIMRNEFEDAETQVFTLEGTCFQLVEECEAAGVPYSLPGIFISETERVSGFHACDTDKAVHERLSGKAQAFRKAISAAPGKFTAASSYPHHPPRRLVSDVSQGSTPSRTPASEGIDSSSHSPREEQSPRVSFVEGPPAEGPRDATRRATAVLAAPRGSTFQMRAGAEERRKEILKRQSIKGDGSQEDAPKD